MHSPDPRLARRDEDLLSPQTQIVADRETYLGQGRRGVGRRISDDQVELFISTDVASALQQEFSLHMPPFVAVHDIGTPASLRLIASLADATGTKVQSLTVRRQGLGVALAVLQFVEVPPTDGPPVRVYATDLNADSATRTQVARVLLAYSTLGVLLVGALPPHALSSQLAPVGEALRRGPWPNRDLLMVPLGAGTALAAQGTQLAGHSGVRVQVTPQASKPRQVWSFIGGAWNRLQHAASDNRALPTEMAQAAEQPVAADSEAVTQIMEMQPPPAARVPPRAPPKPMPRAGLTPWQAYAARCAQIKGSISCCVFDSQSMQPLAHAGSLPSAERMAQQGGALLAAMQAAARALGLGEAPQEATFSTGAHHLLLRPLPGHPGVAVHLLVSSSAGNLTLARMQLERIELPF